jgi:hypothetical protein
MGGEQVEGKDCLEHVGTDGRIILKGSLKTV